MDARRTKNFRGGRSFKMSFSCFHCGAKYKERFSFCSTCFEFNSMLPIPEDTGRTFFQSRQREGIILASSLVNRKFTGMPVPGFDFFGVFPETWKMLLWGLPGKGKTTLAFRFVDSLGMKTLYCSSEQGHSETLQRILFDWEIRQNKIAISDAQDLRELRQDIFEFSPEVLVLDSVSVLGGVIEFPRVIWIVQSTKDGQFKGNQELAHNADVVCCVVEQGKILIQKNRLGKIGEFDF